MVISERLYGATIMFSIRGVFDGDASEEFSKSVQSAYVKGYREFVFNLKDVTAIDKAGLGQLFMTGHELRQKGCSRGIVDPPRHIREQLDLCDIPSLTPIIHQELEAWPVP